MRRKPPKAQHSTLTHASCLKKNVTVRQAPAHVLQSRRAATRASKA